MKLLVVVVVGRTRRRGEHGPTAADEQKDLNDEDDDHEKQEHVDLLEGILQELRIPEHRSAERMQDLRTLHQEESH